MNLNEIWRDYCVLDEISRDGNLSQRKLSKNLGIAVGLTNQIVKRLIRKGLVKTSRINAKRVTYYLTPKGFAEKMHLVSEYVKVTVSLFSCIRDVVKHKLVELNEFKPIQSVAIYGAGEIGEAVFLTVKELGLPLNNVYDDNFELEHWLGMKVKKLDELPSDSNEVLIVSEIEDFGRRDGDFEGNGRVVLMVRDLLSDQLALFARKIEEDDTRKQNHFPK